MAGKLVQLCTPEHDRDAPGSPCWSSLGSWDSRQPGVLALCPNYFCWEPQRGCLEAGKGSFPTALATAQAARGY